MTALNTQQIQELIPHRHPFLWIDEVLDVTDVRVVARKLVPPDWDGFRGHYPGEPILPGVILCEASMQAGAILVARRGLTDPSAALPVGNVPVAARLNHVKFKQMVRPNDLLEIEADVTDRMGQTFFFSAKVRVGEKLVATMDFACTSAPRP